MLLNEKKTMKKILLGLTFSGAVLCAAIGGSIHQEKKVFADLASPFYDVTDVTTPANIKPVITYGAVEGSKTVSGTAAPGATVDVYLPNGKQTLTADKNGKWAAYIEDGLGMGTVDVWAKLDGQDWQGGDKVNVVANPASVKPTITSEPKEGSKSVSGTATAGTAVEVWTNTLDKKNPIKLATVTADNNGKWTATFSDGLQVNHYVQAYTKHGDLWSYQVAVAPVKPVITYGAVEGSKTVSGTAAPGATVEVYFPYGMQTLTADKNGRWAAYIEDGLGLGTVDVRAKLNGQDWQSGEKLIVVANPASVKPTITSEPKEGSKSVSGTATAGTAVEVWTNTLDKKNPIKLATVTADNNGEWTATFSDGLQVNHYVQAYTKHGDLWSYQVNVEQVKSSLKVKNLTYHVGDRIELWEGFVSWTDQDGRITTTIFPGSLSVDVPIALSNNIPGIYEVKYNFKGITATSYVTLLPK